jgi:hypothetical protein
MNNFIRISDRKTFIKTGAVGNYTIIKANDGECDAVRWEGDGRADVLYMSRKTCEIYKAA